jgi:superfamily II DNA or RNA helicase
VSKSDGRDAQILASAISRRGIVPQDQLTQMLKRDGTPLTSARIDDLLTTHFIFTPADTRWRISRDDFASYIRSMWETGDEADTLEERIGYALVGRPLATSFDIHEALSSFGESLTDIEAELASSPLFESEAESWWVDQESYEVWQADQHASAQHRAEGSAMVVRRAEVEVEKVEEKDETLEDELLLYTGPPPRTWQLDALKSWIENQEYGIVEAVTGTGKTLVGILAAARALHHGEAVVVCVPTRLLLSQWSAAFARWIPTARIGELHQDSKDTLANCDILLTTAQSAAMRSLVADDRHTVLIADEVHGYGAPKRQQVLESGYGSRLGLTATLERDNDEGVEEVLLPYFDTVVATYSYADGLRDGVLAPFKIGFVGVRFLPDEQGEYDDLGREMGRISHSLKERGLSAASDKLLFNKIAYLSKDKSADFKDMVMAQKFMANLNRRKAIQAEARAKIAVLESLALPLSQATRGLVFTETIASAQGISAMLDRNNVPSYPYDSSYTGKERESIIKAFRDGEVSVLCAPKILDEGIDVPDADVGVIVAASRSRRQMVQRMGRIVRPNPNGHPSTFFILYIEGTREDPRKGAHEGFLEEVQPHATEVAYFTQDESPKSLATWMKSDQ